MGALRPSPRRSGAELNEQGLRKLVPPLDAAGTAQRAGPYHNERRTVVGSLVHPPLAWGILSRKICLSFGGAHD